MPGRAGEDDQEDYEDDPGMMTAPFGGGPGARPPWFMAGRPRACAARGTRPSWPIPRIGAGSMPARADTVKAKRAAGTRAPSALVTRSGQSRAAAHPRGGVTKLAPFDWVPARSCLVAGPAGGCVLNWRAGWPAPYVRNTQHQGGSDAYRTDTHRVGRRTGRNTCRGSREPYRLAPLPTLRPLKSSCGHLMRRTRRRGATRQQCGAV